MNFLLAFSSSLIPTRPRPEAALEVFHRKFMVGVSAARVTHATFGGVLRNLATASAFSECRGTRRWRVSRPRRSVHALNGLIIAPVSRRSETRILKMNATFPRPGKFPNVSQYFRPW